MYVFWSEAEKAEHTDNNSLSSEQVSLLLQKVFTKDRLKAILLQEEEEDKTKVQNLKQELEGKGTLYISVYYWCIRTVFYQLKATALIVAALR